MDGCVWIDMFASMDKQHMTVVISELISEDGGRVTERLSGGGMRPDDRFLSTQHSGTEIA